MSLEQLFPGQEILRSASIDLPLPWHKLMSLSMPESLVQVVNYLGVGETSAIAKAIGSAIDLGAIAPMRRRERKDARLWTLAVQFKPTMALLFGCPTDIFLRSPITLPEAYNRLVTNLGNLRFNKYSGQLLWPSAIEKVANDISASGGLRTSFTPFFDHRTGDFDVWLDEDYSTACTYNHEIQSVESYCGGGFAGWVERRFNDSLV